MTLSNCLRRMGWAKEQIDEIAEECLASDIKYDLGQMQGWSEDKVREFFENGGAEEAPPPPEVGKVKDIWSSIPNEVKYRTNGTVAVIVLRRTLHTHGETLL